MSIKLKIQSSLFVGLVLSCCSLFSGCIPSVARLDARIEPGWDLGGSVGYHTTQGAAKLPPYQSSTDPKKEQKYMTGELDIQYGKRNEDNSGFAFQLKVPSFAPLTALDAYYELPSPDGIYYGFGAELNPFLSGGYACLTKDLSENFAITSTVRGLYNFGGFGKALSINPQLALVSRFGKHSISLFGSYMHSFGNGLVVNEDFDSGPDTYAKRFIFGGFSVRF